MALEGVHNILYPIINIYKLQLGLIEVKANYQFQLVLSRIINIFPLHFFLNNLMNCDSPCIPWILILRQSNEQFQLAFRQCFSFLAGIKDDKVISYYFGL